MILSPEVGKGNMIEAHFEAQAYQYDRTISTCPITGMSTTVQYRVLLDSPNIMVKDRGSTVKY